MSMDERSNERNQDSNPHSQSIGFGKQSAIVNFLQTFYMNFAHMLAFTGVHAVSSEDDVAKVCKSFSILNDEFFRSDSMIINSSINR